MARVCLGVCIGLVMITAVSRPLFAEDNKSAVREALEARHEKVIYGKHIDHVEYLKLLASLIGGGPAGVAGYLSVLATDIVTETGQEVAVETIYDVLRGKNGNTIVGGKPVYIGIVSYNHWTNENTLGVKWKKPEPNTHQFYIGIGKRVNPTEEMLAFYVIQAGTLHRVDPDSGGYEKLKHDWTGATSMTALDGALYIIQDDKLHRVDPKTGGFEHLKDRWDGPTQMTAMSGSLYVIQNRRLHQVNPNTGELRVLKHDWSEATSMTSQNGSLYIIQNSRLHRVDPFTGDYEWLEGKWDGPTRMTSMNGRLFIVQNKVLHSVNAETGKYELLKHNWDGTTAMAGFGGKLYIIQNNVLHQVNPITGDYEPLKHTWNGPAHATALTLRH